MFIYFYLFIFFILQSWVSNTVKQVQVLKCYTSHFWSFVPLVKPGFFSGGLEPIFGYLLLIRINACKRKVVKKIIKDAWSTFPYICFALYTFRILKTFGINVVLVFNKLKLSSFKGIINNSNPDCGVSRIVCASVLLNHILHQEFSCCNTSASILFPQ